MSELDNSTFDAIRDDFRSLWSFKKHEDSLEISTPFLYPGSDMVRVFVTQREDRFIVTENGDVAEVLRELLETDDFRERLNAMAAAFGMKKGENHGETIYFKDCTDPKLISSIMFDVATFASRAACSIYDNAFRTP